MSGNIQKVHFIAIGGSGMHNLALALHHNGFKVTGSDEEIYEPSHSRLEKAGILPAQTGWFEEKIHKELDAVIIGLNALADNPELIKAKKLGIKIYSYPEYIYKQSVDKHRIVIAGSHGKTTITSMILHVLHYNKKEFDYVVGALQEDFDIMIQLTDAPLIIIEGDEYVTSPIDPTPKFLHYKHHIGLVSGIAWDHFNAYPTFEDYVNQFDAFADSTPKGGMLMYNVSDDLASLICGKEREDVQAFEYSAHKNEIINGQTYLITEGKKIPVQIFGKHNMKNISGAKLVCSKIGITEAKFYEAIQTFKGTSNRLELLGRNDKTSVYKDFAHSPSKLKATTNAVKKQFTDRKLTAVLELHTVSSLSKDFLLQYRDTFKAADEPIVYINLDFIKHKKLENISAEEIISAFNNSKLRVYTDSAALKDDLLNNNWDKKNLLLMSSGNFDGLALDELAKAIVKK